MSSNWGPEVRAVFDKELRSEMRSRSGLLTALLFDIASVTAAAFAASTQKLTPGVAAGLLWVMLIFAAVTSLPRIFISEEEGGTGDLLRLTSRAHAVFWGKALYNLALMAFTAVLLSVLFLTLTGPYNVEFALYGVCLLGGSVAMAAAVTLCGALVAQGSNRTVLAGALAVPLLIPLLALAVNGTAVALGGGKIDQGVSSAIGLWGYGVALMLLGPYLFSAVWKS